MGTCMCMVLPLQEAFDGELQWSFANAETEIANVVVEGGNGVTVRRSTHSGELGLLEL